MSMAVIIGLGVILLIIAVIVIKNIMSFVLFRLIPLAIIGGVVWYFIINEGAL